MTQRASSKVVRILLVVGRLALGAVFLYAAYAKMKPLVAGMPWSVASIKTSLAMFGLQVDSYELLPASLVRAVAHLLPPFELFLGLWLLSGVALRLSSTVTALLIGGFLGVVVRTYMVGLKIHCGCFGGSEPVGPWEIIRDSLFVLLALAVMLGAFLTRRAHRTEAPAEGQPSPSRAD